MGAEALNDLCAAARTSDAALDLALLRIGILAPADLDQIRSVLCMPGASLRACTNGDGHRIVMVSRGPQVVAAIHHDGRVVASAAA